MMDAADDAVPVHGHAGVLGVDVVGRTGIRAFHVVGYEGGRAALAETDNPGDEVGIAGQADAVLLQLDQRSLAQVLADLALEGGEGLFGNPHMLRQPVYG